MPLKPAEKVSLALWLSAARRLDPECCKTDSDAGLALLKQAYGILQYGAESATYHVKSDATIPDYLECVAQELERLLTDDAAPDAPEVASAVDLLRELAHDGDWNGTGDGSAVVGKTGNSLSRCSGVLHLAALIESRVRVLIERETGLPFGRAPIIKYVTALTSFDHEVAPFRLNGRANIRLSPRTVTLVLKEGKITCRDLWHLAYTLHHELVCHAFQSGFAPGLVPNAPERVNDFDTAGFGI
jgi:hypothetical protein